MAAAGVDEEVEAAGAEEVIESQVVLPGFSTTVTAYSQGLQSTSTAAISGRTMGLGMSPGAWSNSSSLNYCELRTAHYKCRSAE